MTDYTGLSPVGGAISVGSFIAADGAVTDSGAFMVLSQRSYIHPQGGFRVGELWAQAYDSAGQPLGPQTAVATNSSGTGGYAPGVLDVEALAGGGWTVAYGIAPSHGGPGSQTGIAVFGTSGQLLKSGPLAGGYSGAPVDIAPLGNGGFVAAWGTTGKYDPGQSYVQTFDAAGNATSLVAQLSNSAAQPLVEAVGANGYVVAYGTGGGYALKYFDGAAFKDPVNLPAGVWLSTSTALSDGKVMYFWSQHDGVEYDLMAVKFDPAANALIGGPMMIHSEAKGFTGLDAVATADGGYLLNWTNSDYIGGATLAFTVGPSGAKSEVFTLDGKAIGTFGAGDSSLLTLTQGDRLVQDYVFGPGEEPARTLHATNTPAEQLSGGAGDDVLHAGQSSVVLTGNGGGDLFVFDNLPWSAGRITDFTLGVDKIDFSKLFAAAGYTGSDPLADGRVSFEAEGATGTRVYFDGDGAGSAHQRFLVTTLEQIQSAGLTWAEIGGTSAGQPPSPPPPNSQIGFVTTWRYTMEGDSGLTPLVYEVARTGETSGAASVEWVLAPRPGYQVNGEDFENGVMPSGILTFAPGETSKSIVVNVRGDEVREQGEGFQLALDDATGATIGTALATGYIENDDAYSDPPPQISFSTQTVTHAEGHSGATAFTYAVTRSGSAQTAATVDWSVTGVGSTPATGADFEGGAYPTGTVSFAAGESTKTFTVLVSGDTALEANEVFRVTLSNPIGAVLGYNTAQGSITNDDTSGPDGGQVYRSPAPNSQMSGTSGNDTFYASQGSDTLTGGAGGDAFIWSFEPWSPATVTDFAVGSDRIDLSHLFRAYNYTGSDPIADGRVVLLDQGADTLVLFDDDGHGGEWPNYIIKLQNVEHSGLTWAQLTRSGGGEEPPPPPPPTGGEVINSGGPGSTLTGGSGDDTLNSSRGSDTLTGNGGADRFVFADENWAPATITDFVSGQDKIDLRGVFDDWGYAGTDPFADGRVILLADSAGTKVLLDDDGPGGDWGNYVLLIQGVQPGQIAASDWMFQ